MIELGRQGFKRICAYLLTLLLALSLASPAFAVESAPYGVALSWTDETSASMTATWRDGEQKAEVMQVVPEAQYDKTGFDGALEFTAVCKDISLDDTGAWHYEATAAGLSPATVYSYRVGGAGAWSETRSFTTDDPAATNITFAYMGDVQPANDSKAEFALWGKLAESAKARNPELAFAILGGDIVNSGISLEQFDLFRESAESTFANIPLFSTVGNHESNFIGGKPELLLDYFAAPENGPEGFDEEFYSFDAGNCHILVLNSWIFSGEQKLTDADYERVESWIAADLAASDADWQIVVTHVPVYQVHSDTTSTAVKENWAPIFEKYGVDLVFEGHQHVYSRSYPMYGGKIDYENGITYIMGVSGSKFYDSADETQAERTIYNTATYQLVQADGDTLTVRTLDAEGNELDYIAITQRACEPPFADVPAGAWYFSAAAYSKAAGLFDGVGNDNFAPNGSMTRAMFVTVLHRYEGLTPATRSGVFTDVPENAWFTEHVNWAAEHKIVDGYGSGLFGPDGNITLEQMVTVLYRFTGASASDTAPLPTAYGAISGWASDAMRWASDAGLFEEIGGALFASEPATRAQVAGLFLALGRM